MEDDAFRDCSGLVSLTLPGSLANIGEDAFKGCVGLTSLTLPHNLNRVGKFAFKNCTALTSAVFSPPASRAFIAWAVGSSRNRTNWQLTILKRMRNIVRTITLMAMSRRDVATLMTGEDHAFQGCTRSFLRKCQVN